MVMRAKKPNTFTKSISKGGNIKSASKTVRLDVDLLEGRVNSQLDERKV
jgi:hypothetical protein